MRTALVLIGLMMIVGLTFAQDDGALLKLDFENDLGGFASADPEAELSIVREEGFAFEGAGALELWYFQRAINPGNMDGGIPGSLMLPIEGGVAGLRAVRFAATAEISTPLAVMLTEGDDDGPRYTAMIWCEGGQWAEYELGIDDFHYDRDSGADADGKLTPESVKGVVVVDIGGFFRFMAEQNPMFHIAAPAEQAIMLDEFELSTTEPETEEAKEGTVPIQDYAWPMVGVALLGGEAVKACAMTEGEGEKALKLEYEVPAQTIFALIHQVRPGSLAGVTKLRLQVKSEKGTALVVNLEERTGPGEDKKANYSSMAQVKAGHEWQTIELPISAFALGDDGVDENGKLDIENVVMAMVIDLGAMVGQADVTNTLQVRGLVGVK